MTAPSGRMKLMDLVRRWGPEIGKTPDMLATAIIRAATVNGEFDELPEDNRLGTIDDSLVFQPIGKGRLVEESDRLERQARADLNYIGAESFVTALAVFFHVHQDAIAKFAANRGLALPTWWGQPEHLADQAAPSIANATNTGPQISEVVNALRKIHRNSPGTPG